MLNDLHRDSLTQFSVQSIMSETREEAILVPTNLCRWSGLKFPKEICRFESR